MITLTNSMIAMIKKQNPWELMKDLRSLYLKRKKMNLNIKMIMSILIMGRMGIIKFNNSKICRIKRVLIRTKAINQAIIRTKAINQAIIRTKAINLAIIRTKAINLAIIKTKAINQVIIKSKAVISQTTKIKVFNQTITIKPIKQVIKTKPINQLINNRDISLVIINHKVINHKNQSIIIKSKYHLKKKILLHFLMIVSMKYLNNKIHKINKKTTLTLAKIDPILGVVTIKSYHIKRTQLTMVKIVINLMFKKLTRKKTRNKSLILTIKIRLTNINNNSLTRLICLEINRRKLKRNNNMINQ